MLLLVSWPSSAAAAFLPPSASSTVSTRSSGRPTVLSGLAMSGGGGGGFGEKASPAKPKVIKQNLLRWGEANGVDYGGSLSVKEFGGIRGVAADEPLVPGTRVLAVPAALALQVTTPTLHPDHDPAAKPSLASRPSHEPHAFMGARVSSRVDPNLNLSQVTTNQPAPPWADKELWRSSTWYVRLALRLLHEKGKGSASELAPWVEQLPASFVRHTGLEP